MEKNIRSAEETLGRADGRYNDNDMRESLALVGLAQGIVALAKGIGAIGAIMYLRHIEEVRGGKPNGDDAGITKLEELARKGLGL